MMRAVIGKSGSKAVHELATLGAVQGAALPGAKAATHLETRKTQDITTVLGNCSMSIWKIKLHHSKIYSL